MYRDVYKILSSLKDSLAMDINNAYLDYKDNVNKVLNIIIMMKIVNSLTCNEIKINGVCLILTRTQWVS